MLQRRLIAVEGVVQGVGFRPYVHRLAAERNLRGFVRNDAGGVLIDVEGDAPGVEAFCQALTRNPPPLAAIASVRVDAVAPKSYHAFEIAPSDRSSSATPQIPRDVATCDDCLRELFDSSNRRYRHPFITCTQCGPRLTIVRETPYDRVRTTMAGFPLCADCAREYADPADRRFHAEAIGCHACGPVLRASGAGMALHGAAALDGALTVLASGGIVAVKALGGYQLACDARNEEAVALLRARKHRPAKPLALMVFDASRAAQLCAVSPSERALLESPARPIVLLSATGGSSGVAPSVAPGQRSLGVMLPSTPIHYLLLAALDRPLVMTSGNRSDEPVCVDDAVATQSLGAIADLVLAHDRPIATRCDDSVARVVSGETRMMRRARGYVPDGITLARSARLRVLALGGHLKNTVCLIAGNTAMLSPHIGDLDSGSARDAFRDAVATTVRLLGAQPQVIAHDLHPDYASTTLAHRLCREMGIEHRVEVQHHHAHVAAAVAESGEPGPTIGVVFDGAGLGTDGAIWGGEFLVVDGARFSREGHLAYVPLPGGDAAARQPWRSAAAHLARSERTAQRPAAVAAHEWALVQSLIGRPSHAARTSSVGRLFDAVASLLGVCHVSTFEGEAATRLESIADGQLGGGYPIALSEGDPWTADSRALIEGVLADVHAGREVPAIASAFHATMRDLVVLGCERIRAERSLSTVVLTGGVFTNALLLAHARTALQERGFRVIVPRLAPCNDGGLALGQAYVGARALEDAPCA